MYKTLSLVLVLLLVTIGHVRADPLTEDMTKLNAQWDAAINDPNFDALLPMYAADASLMPPGTAPVSGPTAIRDFFAKRGTSVRNHKLELVDILQMGRLRLRDFALQSLIGKRRGNDHAVRKYR
jgi:ketosteroid isomerase-like protein